MCASRAQHHPHLAATARPTNPMNATTAMRSTRRSTSSSSSSSSSALSADAIPPLHGTSMLHTAAAPYASAPPHHRAPPPPPPPYQSYQQYPPPQHHSLTGTPVHLVHSPRHVTHTSTTTAYVSPSSGSLHGGAVPPPSARSSRRPQTSRANPPTSSLPSSSSSSTYHHHFSSSYASPTTTATATSTQPPDSLGALENEYITNLQQQVYFLELELNLLKKSGGGGGTSGTTTAGDSNDPDAPLDDVMLNLRTKYITMEQDYREKLRTMEQDNRVLTERSQLLDLELQQARDHANDLQAHLDACVEKEREARSLMIEHKLRYDDAARKIGDQLGDSDERSTSVQERLRNVIAELSAKEELWERERAEWQEERVRADQKVSQIEESERRCQEAILELRDQLRVPEKNRMQEEIDALQTERLEFEKQVKQLTMQLEASQAAERKHREHITTLLADLSTLSGTIVQLTREKEAWIAEQERARGAREWWSSEVVEMRKRLEQEREEREYRTRKMDELQAANKELKHEQHRLRAWIEEEQARQNDEQRKRDLTDRQVNEREEQRVRVLADLMLLQEEQKHDRDELAKTRTERDALARQVQVMQAQLDDLELVRQEREIVDSLKLNEFVAMAHSNLKVADSIERLMAIRQQRRRQQKGASSGAVSGAASGGSTSNASMTATRSFGRGNSGGGSITGEMKENGGGGAGSVFDRLDDDDEFGASSSSMAHHAEQDEDEDSLHVPFVRTSLHESSLPPPPSSSLTGRSSPLHAHVGSASGSSSAPLPPSVPSAPSGPPPSAGSADSAFVI